MMVQRRTQGEENGVKWIVDPHGDVYIIVTHNTKTGEIRTKPYVCQHRPIFGLDVDDANEIERILAEMIVGAAEDEEDL